MSNHRVPINPTKNHACSRFMPFESTKPFKDDGLSSFFDYIDQFESIEDVPKEIIEYGREKYFPKRKRVSV